MPIRTAPTFMKSKSGFFRVIATIAVALREKIDATTERRRVRAALSKLDDHMLKDMGIARSDVERIANRTYPPR